MRRKNKFFFWGIFIGVVLVDQLLKCAAEIHLKHRDFICGRWLSFTLSHNMGCAWGFFQNRAMILGLLGIVIFFFMYFFRKIFKIYEYPVAFGLLLGGIMGNVIDRLFRGFVIDFIDINLQVYRWPTFNIADAAMFIAVLHLLFFQSPREIESGDLESKSA